MSERNYSLELAVCPHCGAVCVNGHDDDGHIYCAKCKQSFVPKELTQITDDEYRKLVEESKGSGNMYECSGWTAFVRNSK